MYILYGYVHRQPSKVVCVDVLNRSSQRESLRSSYQNGGDYQGPVGHGVRHVGGRVFVAVR